MGDLERYLSVQGFDIYVYTSIHSVLAYIHQLETKDKDFKDVLLLFTHSVSPYLLFYQQNIRKLV